MTIELDYMEYSSDALAQAAYVTNGGVALKNSYADTNRDSDRTLQGSYAADWSQEGQAFTTTSAFKLTSCKFLLSKSGSPTGNAVAILFAATGTVGTDAVPTGSALATSDVFDISTSTTTPTLITFTFSGAQQYILANATDYVIVFRNPASGVDASNYVLLGIDTTSQTSGGNCAYWTSSAWTGLSSQADIFYVYGLVLQSYSEATIKQQGSYSLKGVAVITGSLNDTLTRTVDPPIDLSDQNTVKLGAYALRTGTNFEVKIRDSGGVWTTLKQVNIITSNEWQTEECDISGVSNINKDAIDRIQIKIIEASADNTFYLDNMYALIIGGILSQIILG